MASNDRAQRIGIWIIAIVMTVGTIGSFVVIILSNDNQQVEQAAAQAQAVEQQKVATAAAKEQAKSLEPLVGYNSRAFDPAAVTTLKAEVLQEGTGEAVKVTDSINSSYFGWTSDGAIFDSSKKKDKNDTPITFPLSGVIKGWGEGLTGVKVGSVVRLTIPSDKAYGPTGQGPIPANAPLEFIVVINKIDNTASSTK